MGCGGWGASESAPLAVEESSRAVESFELEGSDPSAMSGAGGAERSEPDFVAAFGDFRIRLIKAGREGFGDEELADDGLLAGGGVLRSGRGFGISSSGARDLGALCSDEFCGLDAPGVFADVVGGDEGTTAGGSAAGLFAGVVLEAETEFLVATLE